MGWYSNIQGTSHWHDPEDPDYDESVSNPDKWQHPPPKPRGDTMTDSGEEYRKGKEGTMAPIAPRRKIQPIE